MSDDEVVDKHPSFGMARFTRCQGSPGRLFGSSLERHYSFIKLTVTEAECIHSLGHDRFHAGRILVQVDLSPAQFAELLTTMNVGDGAPCTLRYVAGKRIDPPPEETKLEAEKVRDSFKASLTSLVNTIEADRGELKTMLAKKSLTVDDRQRIEWMLGRVHQAVKANVPFMLDQFEEAADRIVTHAKAEVDAFATHAVMAAGVKAIAARNDADELPPLLEGS